MREVRVGIAEVRSIDRARHDGHDLLARVPRRATWCILTGIVAPQIVPKPEQRQTRFVPMPPLFFPPLPPSHFTTFTMEEGTATTTTTAQSNPTDLPEGLCSSD